MAPLKDTQLPPMLRFLLGSACLVILMWGIKTASPILGPLLLSLLLAYAIVPFPQWLIEHFKLKKSTAIAATAVAFIALDLFLVLPLDMAFVRVAAKLPVYEERLALLYEHVAAFMTAHGMAAPTPSIRNVLTPDRLRELTRIIVPEAGEIISDGLLISLLTFLFVVEMAEDIGVKRGPLAESLAFYGSTARSYIAVTAKTAGINALVNLAFLVVMRVDTPGVWCFLYFFLDFIPTLGYLIALVPPTLIALLMFGWKRALFVACGLVLTNVIVDNVVTPIFMKHAVDISFMEITLSLVVWTFLLGMPGAILAVPLTLGLRKFVAKTSHEEQLDPVSSG